MNWKLVPFALCAGAAVYTALAIRASGSGPVQLIQSLNDPVSVAAAETSGNRLKAKYVSGEDGSQLFDPERLHDSALDVDCTFRKAGDGATRCLPLGQDLSGGGGAVIFTDDDCTQGVVYLRAAPSGCTPSVPAYALRFDSDVYCGTAQEATELNAHVYPITSVTAPPNGTVYRRDDTNDTNDTCTATSPPQSGVAYALGPEVPASDFVEGTAGVVP